MEKRVVKKRKKKGIKRWEKGGRGGSKKRRGKGRERNETLNFIHNEHSNES